MAIGKLRWANRDVVEGSYLLEVEPDVCLAVSLVLVSVVTQVTELSAILATHVHYRYYVIIRVFHMSCEVIFPITCIFT